MPGLTTIRAGRMAARIVIELDADGVAELWVLADPIDDTLLIRETRRRRFTGPQRGHIRTRDQYCRQ